MIKKALSLFALLLALSAPLCAEPTVLDLGTETYSLEDVGYSEQLEKEGFAIDYKFTRGLMNGFGGLQKGLANLSSKDAYTAKAEADYKARVVADLEFSRDPMNGGLSVTTPSKETFVAERASYYEKTFASLGELIENVKSYAFSTPLLSLTTRWGVLFAVILYFVQLANWTFNGLHSDPISFETFLRFTSGLLLRLFLISAIPFLVNAVITFGNSGTFDSSISTGWRVLQARQILAYHQISEAVGGWGVKVVKFFSDFPGLFTLSLQAFLLSVAYLFFHASVYLISIAVDFLMGVTVLCGPLAIGLSQWDGWVEFGLRWVKGLVPFLFYAPLLCITKALFVFCMCMEDLSPFALAILVWALARAVTKVPHISEQLTTGIASSVAVPIIGATALTTYHMSKNFTVMGGSGVKHLLSRPLAEE